MAAASAAQDKLLAGNEGVSRVSALPSHFPAWAAKLAELYFSGTTSMFVLSGNVFDLVRMNADGSRWSGLAEFLAEQLFGRWDVILHYDLARGLRPLAGANGKRLQEMVTACNRVLGDVRQVKRDPITSLAAIDLFVQKNVMADAGERLSAAVILDHASFIAPNGDRLQLSDQTQLVTLLNWASSPYVKRLNLAFVMIDSRLSQVSDRLTSNPHVAALEVPLPGTEERQLFLANATRGLDVGTFSDFTTAELGALTAGIALTDLEVLVRSAREGGRRLDANYFRELKKRLIERQAQGMLEFVEPKWGLDTVVGHEAAKRRLLDDAALLKKGRLDSVPMGYLFSGPVGTGKSFLAQCVAGSIGVPAVVLKNFRSKYVGETEGNLERVLGVLRSMGPVVVVVDEADTVLGDRDSGGGDSGIGARVFGMLASQMGDTRYRGKIIWMLLTARPDLLPIDIKRQGRAEVHIPLFYPSEDAELRAMFRILARKAGSTLLDEDIPAELPHKGNLSGADVEGIVGRAQRTSLLAGSERITRAALEQALASFMPSTQSLEREMQELVAMIECTDAEFLPPAKKARLEQLGGRDKAQERANAIKQILEGR
ncbi:MAG TPA: AAA family ATPase [Kofleriaceae bacterium]|nr:AAA family ATPase [Kofleriaceae bacterium]